MMWNTLPRSTEPDCDSRDCRKWVIATSHPLPPNIGGREVNMEFVDDEPGLTPGNWTKWIRRGDEWAPSWGRAVASADG